MSSRQAEKERRREERLARERAEAKAAERRRRLQYAFGGLLALAAIAGVVVLVTSGIAGGDGNGGGDGDGPRAPEQASVQLPQQQTADLRAAAKAAGCKLANPPIEGATHVDKEFQPSDYRTNPPTSGDHFADWYEDGIYEPGDVPTLGMLVHTLEHGRINVQYKPGTPASTVEQLEALLAEQSQGYHMLLYENTTGMDAQVAATAWGHSVTCPEMNDKVFDALRTFRQRWIDKGPEQVP